MSMGGAGGMTIWPMLAMGIGITLVVLGLVYLVVLLLGRVTGDAESMIRGESLRRLPAATDRARLGHSSALPEGEVDGYVIIPDISGYTNFMQLTRYSLAHAQYAITALLGSVIDAAERRLAPSKLEGDAVLLYGVRRDNGGPGLDGAEVGRAVVELATAFYEKRAELARDNTCPCEACRNVDKLELKTVVHRGAVLLYDIRGHHEISGVPVIVAHRLLKNSLGLARYVLVTDDAHRDVRLPMDCRIRRHWEHFEGVGEIAAHVYDFQPQQLPGAGAGTSGVVAKAAEAGRKLRANWRGLRQ